jgi:3-oxoacyl-[acyl-carrier-protein] synthase-3
MHGSISAIEYYLPEKGLTTEELAALFPAWSVAKIDAKTGIHVRHIAADAEYTSDLAFKAAQKLFSSGACHREDIDFILLCTQSADYALPTTACLLQSRLDIPRSAGALDYNLGCSGYIYGLGLAEGLISSGQASVILLITADTYSKYMDPSDKAVRTLFGDGATATLIEATSEKRPLIGPFVYGTDGRGAGHLIVPNSGTRQGCPPRLVDSRGGLVTEPRLYMDGQRIFQFAIEQVPTVVASILEKGGVSRDNVDLFVFHQANKYILDELRRILEIPSEKFQITLRDCANTVSSTIPIALKHAEQEGKLQNDSLILLVGFGVGFSWGAALVRWRRLTGLTCPQLLFT